MLVCNWSIIYHRGSTEDFEGYEPIERYKRVENAVSRLESMISYQHWAIDGILQDALLRPRPSKPNYLLLNLAGIARVVAAGPSWQGSRVDGGSGAPRRWRITKTLTAQKRPLSNNMVIRRANTGQKTRAEWTDTDSDMCDYGRLLVMCVCRSYAWAATLLYMAEWDRHREIMAFVFRR